MQLVDEVLGVLAYARAKLRELGPQLEDRWPRDGRLAGSRTGSAWAGPRLRSVSMLQGEVLVVAVTHGGLEALDRGSLVAQSVGLAGGDLGSVELMVGWGVEDEQFGWFSRARERGVGPVALKSSGRPTTPAHSTVAPWTVCAVST